MVDDKDILKSEKHYLASSGAVAGTNNVMIILEVVAPRITKITQLQVGDLNISKILDFNLNLDLNGGFSKDRYGMCLEF